MKIILCRTCQVAPVKCNYMICINCWEVEHRLAVYARSAKGLQYLVAAIVQSVKGTEL